MVKMMGLGPIFDGMGLINTIYSYEKDIAISFTSDRTMMPDPSAYAESLRRSFDALKAATSGGASKKPAPAPVAAAKPVAAPKTPKAPLAKAVKATATVPAKTPAKLLKSPIKKATKTVAAKPKKKEKA